MQIQDTEFKVNANDLWGYILLWEANSIIGFCGHIFPFLDVT